MRNKNLNLILISLFIYCINQIFKSINIDLGIITIFLKGYCNDILAGIVILSFSNLLLETVHKPLNTLLKIEGFLFIVGCFWEYITPLYNPNSTSDPFDLFAYLFGGLIYWIITFKNHEDVDFVD